MDLYPLTFPVTRIRRTPGGIDELGNDVITDAEDEVLVFGWSQISPQEPVVAGHPRIEVDATLIADVGDFVPTDAVVLPGEDDPFEVVGPAQNFDNNPWWSPSREVVNLRRIQR